MKLLTLTAVALAVAAGWWAFAALAVVAVVRAVQR